MPLLHEPMVPPLGLNGQAVKHSRLADGEVADVDHLLYFALAFGDDLAGLERDELAELRFQFAQGVPELTHGFAADWSRRNAPFLEGLLGGCDRLLVFRVCRRPDTRQKFAVDRRKFFDDRSTASPIAVEDAGIFRADSE